jgi:hypothetical protein
MLQVDPPLRITASAIGIQIRRKALLASKIGVLPKTKEVLTDVCETRAQWQCRRLRWAAEKLECQHRTPFRTTLTRAARLNDARLSVVATKLAERLAHDQVR